uniref:Uncharacterized protein n=1 Tax=Romanomermis culicivorax TaxID=13658 RepID=A0A915KXS1_ROMCU
MKIQYKEISIAFDEQHIEAIFMLFNVLHTCTIKLLSRAYILGSQFSSLHKDFPKDRLIARLTSFIIEFALTTRHRAIVQEKSRDSSSPLASTFFVPTGTTFVEIDARPWKKISEIKSILLQ